MEVTDFANRAEWWMRLDDGWQGGQGWKELSATPKHRLSMAVGKESEVSDLHKATRQHMEQEASNELDRIQGHFFDLIVVLRVSPAKAYFPVV
jgi:hypothetical protein